MEIQDVPARVKNGDAGFFEVAAESVWLVGRRLMAGEDMGEDAAAGIPSRPFVAERFHLGDQLGAHRDACLGAVLRLVGTDYEIPDAALLDKIAPTQAARLFVAQAGVKQREVGDAVVLGNGEQTPGFVLRESATGARFPALRDGFADLGDGVAVKALRFHQPPEKRRNADLILFERFGGHGAGDAPAPSGEGRGVCIADSLPFRLARHAQHPAGGVLGMRAAQAARKQVHAVILHHGGEIAMHRRPHGVRSGEPFPDTLPANDNRMQAIAGRHFVRRV